MFCIYLKTVIMKKKIRISFIPLMLVGISLLLSNSCKKEKDEVTDADGYIYKTVTIGTQIWMAENLKTTKYNDGAAIPNVTSGTTWAGLTTGAYCWYLNDETAFKNTYGALYNWYAVNTGKLCPTGWHVPSYDEWGVLDSAAGYGQVAGGNLKETGEIHWMTPNNGATNETGFTALPGGFRYHDGTFDWMGYHSFWWTATEYNSTIALDAFIVNYDNYLGFSFSDKKECGMSVRCIKD
jgi:uncharacterized protein (TIGR02145 family)